MTQLIGLVNGVVNSGVSTNSTRQSLDSTTDLNTITIGFLMDTWSGSKPTNAPTTFSVYGTLLMLGRTQIVIDNSSGGSSSIAVRSYDETNVWTVWRTI